MKGNRHLKCEKEELISVIVPVYNAERYLDECLSSIINQTYKNLEIILVDDGSIDGCGALCDAWKEKDCRVKVAHTENKGVSHARNLGLELSTGQYLSFVDADDWIDKDMYTCMMEVIKDAGVDVCIGGVLKEYTSQTVNEFFCEDERCSVFVRQELIKEMFSVKHKKLFSWFLVDKLFSRNVIANNRLDENVSHGEDMLFMWYVLKHVKKAGYVPAFKYHYRMHEKSATHVEFNEKMLTEFDAVNKMLQSISAESEDIQDTINRLYLRKQILAIRIMLKVNPDKYRVDICKRQELIRRNWKKIFFEEGISFMARAGILYCCLPYEICLLARFVI